MYSLSIWFASILSVTIISLVGFIVVFFLPRFRLDPKSNFNQLVVSLAIGTLLSDAFLHHLPHSFLPHHHIGGNVTNATSTEEHDHDEHDEHDEHDGHQHIHNDKVMLYCSIVLAGILLFLMLERVLEILCKFSLHAHNHHTLGEHEGDVVVEDVEGNIVKNLATAAVNSKLPAEEEGEEGEQDDEFVVQMKLNDTNDTNGLDYQQPKSYGQALTETLDGMQVNGKSDLKVYNECLQMGLAITPDGDGFIHLTTHHHHQSGKKNTTPIMILIGDVIHNMFDGLAIGISYATGGIPGGLSTSVAILCHELPHELGDFSIALSSGVSTRNAYTWNLAASFVGMVGCVVGLLLGTLEVSWLSSAVAGTFIYVSLVNMVPELDSCPKLPRTRRLVKLFWQFAGLSIGVAIMAMIIFFE